MQAHAIAHPAAGPGMRPLLTGALLVFGLTLGPVGCSTSHRASPGPIPQAHTQHAQLELNGGKKWVMPQPMMVYFRNIEKAVQDSEKTPGRDHAALATQIQENLGQLVTHCTMEGQAHDALHQWLMPFLGLSTDYSKATDPQVQQQKLQEMKQALLVFHEYFE